MITQYAATGMEVKGETSSPPCMSLRKYRPLGYSCILVWYAWVGGMDRGEWTTGTTTTHETSDKHAQHKYNALPTTPPPPTHTHRLTTVASKFPISR